MFLGQYRTTFTGLGRIILPKKFREDLKEEKEIILSYGFEKCVFGFNKSDWEKEARKQLELPLTSLEGRNIRRYLFSAAENVVLDEQGRFVVPKNLMDYANLKEKVIIIGAGDHFEIWNEKFWEKLNKNILNEKTEIRRRKKTNQ